MTQQQTAADTQVKAKHRAMWAFGDYDDVAVRPHPRPRPGRRRRLPDQPR